MNQNSYLNSCVVRTPEGTCFDLLTEDEIQIKALENQYKEHIDEFEKHIAAILNGNKEMGVIAVDSGSEIARKIQALKKYQTDKKSNAQELIQHHLDALLYRFQVSINSEYLLYILQDDMLFIKVEI